MNQTKKTWRQYWLILRYYKFPAIAVFLVTLMLAITAAIKVERIYTVNSKIQIESPNNELIDSLDREQNLQQNKQDNQQNLVPESTEITEINSTNLTKKLFEQLKTSDNNLKSLDYDKFVNKLDIKDNSRTGIIDITYSGNDLDSSKLVVDSLVQLYKSQQTETNLSNIQQIKDKFNQQLTVANKNRKEITSKLKNLLTKYDRNILESKPGYLKNKLKEIEEKMASAKSEIKKVDVKINELKSQLGLDIDPDTASGQFSGSPEQQKLLQQLQEVESQLIVERGRFSDANPVIINLQAEKAKLEAQLNNSNSSNRQYISVNQNNNNIPVITEQLVTYEAEKKSWLTKIESWEIDKARYQKDNAIAPEIKQQYQELLTQEKKAQEQYSSLLNKAQQLEIVSEENIANIKIINPTTVKNNLASRNKELIAASGIGLGFILAVAIVLALDSKSPCLKTSEEMSQLFDSKILGEIPDLRNSDFHISHRSQPVSPERFVLEAPYSVACEAYKIVYDNLEFSKADRVIKLITVASPNVDEGKSTFIANLAALTTQLGKKVLIIDANLQTPKQKAIWQIDNNLGLTDILNKAATFENVVQAPNLNLNVITAGSMVEDYLSLWESEQMTELLSYIRKQYDLVIFDTPAISLYSDALKISQFTDGIILVGRIGVTNPQKALATKELIAKSNQEILGLVVNDKFDN